MSLCQPSSRWVHFLNQRRMEQQRERNGLRISYSLSKIHRASNPHCPGLHIGLFNISGLPTFQSGVLRLFHSRCAAHLFIYCQLQLPCYSYRFQCFLFLFYCLLKSECSLHMRAGFLLSPVCLLSEVLACVITSPISDSNVISK